MEKFQEYNLTLNQKEKNMVINYLNNIKNYIKAKNIDMDCYNDIEEMVFEKLSKSSELNQLKIKQILKEVWEPSDIFGDIWVENTKQDQTFYEKMIFNGWFIQKENAMILWICSLLSQKFSIPVLFIRILFIFWFLFLGLSFWLYFLAWIFIPVYWIDYSEKSMFQYFVFQLKHCIKFWISNFLKLFIILFKKIMNLIKTIFKFFIDNFWPVIRFWFFGLIWFFLSFAILWLVWVLGFSLWGFSFENVDFFTNLSPFLNIALVLWIIWLSIFTFSSFSFWLAKKSLNKYFLFSAFISLVVSFLFFTMFWVEISKKYTNFETIKSNYDVNLSWTWGNLDLKLDLFNNENRLDFFNISWIEIALWTWNVLKAEFIDKIYWDEEITSKIKQNLSQLEVKTNWNKIDFKYQNDKVFKDKVPFSFINRKIILYVPKNYTLKFDSNNYFKITWVELSKKIQKYSKYSYDDCNNSKIYFDNSDNKFYCENENNLQTARKSYIEDYLIKNFDSWSKITHKSKYKREYYDDWFEDFDWKVDSINWLDDNTLELTISDKTITLTSKISIKENENNVEVLSQELKKLDYTREDYDENDKKFEQKYYNNTEFLSGALLNLE